MKQLKPFIFIILLIVLTENKEPKNSDQVLKEYTISEIVDLIEDCKTNNYKIIDPDGFVKAEDEKKLEKQFKEVYKNHKVVPIIVLVKRLHLKDKNEKNIDISNFTQIVIDEIYDKKIVKKNIPAIVAVISIEGKIMTMKAQGKVSHIITQQDCYTIFNVVNNYFSYGEYSYGAVELGKLINYYLVNTSFFGRNKRYIILFGLLIFSFSVCYLMAVIARRIMARRNLRLTMSDEEKLIKIKDFLKKTRANKKILCDNCIICLEPFDNCTSINHSLIAEEKNNKNENLIANEDKNNKNNIILNLNEKEKEKKKENEKEINIEMQNISLDNIENSISSIIDNQISTLPCGHRYHVKCISEWMLKKKSICPLCKEKINVDIPENNEEDDLQNELLNIQSELHPAFALLVFQTINNELTWGVMALPGMNGGLFAGLGGFAFI